MGTRRLLWVRMHDVQEWLGKNISDLVRKDIYVFFFETKSHTNDQIRKYKRSGEKLFSVDVFTYVCTISINIQKWMFFFCTFTMHWYIYRSSSTRSSPEVDGLHEWSATGWEAGKTSPYSWDFLIDKCGEKIRTSSKKWINGGQSVGKSMSKWL